MEEAVKNSIRGRVWYTPHIPEETTGMIDTIITHERPDWDAIGSAWLLRQAYPTAGIVCASRAQIEEHKDNPAVAIVDCGGVYDPERLRFDHHQFPGAEASATCAMHQVFEFLECPAHLSALVALVEAGDAARNEAGADWSRVHGLHAQLAARTAAGWTDAELMQWGCEELDILAAHLQKQAQAREELTERLVWRSEDGLIAGIEYGEQRHSHAAFAAGAVLCVWRSDVPVENGTSHAIGVSRNPAAEAPHVGSLLKGSYIKEEIARDGWYCHPAGFMAGRGTGKAQRFDPVPDGLDVAWIAQALDKVWTR